MHFSYSQQVIIADQLKWRENLTGASPEETAGRLLRCGICRECWNCLTGSRNLKTRIHEAMEDAPLTGTELTQHEYINTHTF
jgi:hypothetical protein